jgi:hypothetical protein
MAATKGELASSGGSTWYSGIVGSGVVAQPGARLNYKTDGTVEGSITFRCDESNTGNLPQIGVAYPGEAAAKLHNIEVVRLTNRLVEATCSFHGISFEKGEFTQPTIEYPGAVDQMPIEIHPRFSIIAGTPAAPANGAAWVDRVTRKESEEADAVFDGFQDPAFPAFYSLEVFYQARPLVYRNYWSRNPPTLQQGCTIVDSIPGYTNPPGIVNWLLLDTPFRQIGQNSYQVTEQYKGSPAPGWNPAIYRRA